jgi:hypothetical protein
MLDTVSGVGYWHWQEDKFMAHPFTGFHFYYRHYYRTGPPAVR